MVNGWKWKSRLLPNKPRREADEPYDELAQFIRESRNQHARDAVPYLPFLGAGFNARPWSDPRAGFAFPTREQWLLELRRLQSDFDRISTLGLPLPSGRRQKAFTIYAWNEFGEGGIVAPTRGEGTMKLEGIREVYGSRPRHAVKDYPPGSQHGRHRSHPGHP